MCVFGASALTFSQFEASDRTASSHRDGVVLAVFQSLGAPE